MTSLYKWPIDLHECNTVDLGTGTDCSMYCNSFSFYFIACRLQFNKVRAQEMPSTTVRYDNWVLLLFKHGNILFPIGKQTIQAN